MNRKLPARLLLVPLALLGCLLAMACSPGSPATWLGAESTPAPTPTPLPTAVIPEKPTYTVERGEVVDSLAFTGRVSPLNEAELYFRTDGRVLQVYVERGQAVQAGERLAELDVSALHRQLAQADLSLETALTDLRSAEDERAYNLARARVNLETELVALNKLQDYDPAVDLAVTLADLESATISLQRAQGRYDAVAHEPNIAMRPEAQALQEATLAYERARAAHDQAVRQSEQRAYDAQAQEKRVELARLEVERLEAGVDPRLEQSVARAELDLADLRAQITDTLILAPFAGEVTAMNTAAGRAVEGYRPVIVVADLSELEVTAELAADDMGELSEGQEATVAPVEFPGQTLPASIRLLPYPYGSGGSAPALSGEGAEEADRATHLDVQFGDLVVEPGDLVRVTVVLERKENVLWLPPAAIRTFEGRKFVVVQEGAVQRRVDVTVGVESEERVEIVSGLEDGNVVVGP